MRILIKGLGIGGAERLVASAASHWDRSRFDYSVAYVLPWKDQLVPELTSLGIPTTCIGGKLGVDPATPLRLRSLVRRAGVQLVHAHLPMTGVLARLVPGPPVIYTEHNLASSYRQPTRVLNRLSYGLNRAVIAVSDAVRESLSGFPGPEPVVVPNGVTIDLDESAVQLAREELGITADERLVVHVGNIRPHKGHDTLVEMARTLLSRRDDVTVVSIGGEKFPGDLERLRKRSADLGIADRMRFLGRRPDATAFIAAADVFVNPADVEGLPVAILEAQALGTPIVATAVGGVPSVVIDGETGVLVAPRNPAEMAAQLERLLDDSLEANRMAVAARKLVLDHHSLEAMVHSYERLYSTLIEGESA